MRLGDGLDQRETKAVAAAGSCPGEWLGEGYGVLDDLAGVGHLHHRVVAVAEHTHGRCSRRAVDCGVAGQVVDGLGHEGDGGVDTRGLELDRDAVRVGDATTHGGEVDGAELRRKVRELQQRGDGLGVGGIDLADACERGAQGIVWSGEGDTATV